MTIVPQQAAGGKSWTVWAVAAILAVTLGLVNISGRHHAATPLVRLESVPVRLAGWKLADEQPLAPTVLKGLRPTDYISRIYRRDHYDLGLFVAYYAEQRSGESIHSPKHCLPGSGWEIWDYGSALVPLHGGAVEINKYSIQSAGDRRIVLYWYQSRNRIIKGEYLGKILLMHDAILEGSTAGALVRIVLRDDPTSVAEGIEFASQLIPYVQRCFGN